MRIGILGPLEVRDVAGQPVRLAGPRLRALLIRLALDRGRAVAVDRLAGDLWPDDARTRPPRPTRATRCKPWFRLRHAAGPGMVEYGAAVTGWPWTPAPRRDPVRARWPAKAAPPWPPETRQLRRAAGGALDLWRGPALADVDDAAFAAGPVARLEELRLAATEDLTEAGPGPRPGAELAPEAEELATAHPLRERLRGQFMRALYLAGRQADALAVYEDTRRLLAERLGVDPSPALSAVHLAILRADPDLGPLPGTAPFDLSRPRRSRPGRCAGAPARCPPGRASHRPG